MRWLSRFGARCRSNYSTEGPGPPALSCPRRSWTGSKPSTISDAVTPASGTSHQSTTNAYTNQSPPDSHNPSPTNRAHATWTTTRGSPHTDRSDSIGGNSWSCVHPESATRSLRTWRRSSTRWSTRGDSFRRTRRSDLTKPNHQIEQTRTLIRQRNRAARFHTQMGSLPAGCRLYPRCLLLRFHRPR